MGLEISKTSIIVEKSKNNISNSNSIYYLITQILKNLINLNTITLIQFNITILNNISILNPYSFDI